MNERDHMSLSPEGEAALKLWEEEGGRPKLKAYNDGTGTWTIGWGCTKGVSAGDTCTADEAQAMFDAEIDAIESGLRHWLKRDVSQGLWDALSSFGYNNGWGKCPTLQRAVNTGSDADIRNAFMLYTKARDERTGKTITWPGLVARRQKELAHWAHMDALAAHGDAVRPPPAIQPDQSAKDLVKSGSRSLTWVQWLKKLLLGTGVSTAGLMFSPDALDGFGWLRSVFFGTEDATSMLSPDGIQRTKGYIDALKTLIADHASLLILAGIVTGYVMAHLAQHFLVEAAKDGRYVPQGSK